MLFAVIFLKSRRVFLVSTAYYYGVCAYVRRVNLPPTRSYPNGVCLSSRKLSELLRKQLELTRKRKKSLEDLYVAGKISIQKGLTVIGLESKIKTFSERMTKRVNELGKHVKSLEMFLTTLKNHYATEEAEKELIDESREIIMAETGKYESESITQSKPAKGKLQESPLLVAQSQEEEKIPEAVINEVFSYLERHRETSLSQIAEDIHLPVSVVEKVLAELERHGKIKLM